MVKFYNKLTGTEMWVADNRAEEYMTAGHKPAVVVVEAEKPTKTEEKPKRATAKRTRK